MKDFATMFAAALALIASPFALFAVGRVLFLALAAFLGLIGLPVVAVGEEFLVMLVLFVIIGVAALVAATIAKARGWI